MSKTGDGIRKVARFSWGMSLFGIRQTAELMTALCTARSPRQATAAFDAVAGAAADQLEEGLSDAYRDGDRWQGELLDAVFRAVDPVVDASRELASQTLVRGSLAALRQSATVLETAMPSGSRVSWQELRDKLEAFDGFQYADRILGFEDAELSLQAQLERAERRGPFRSLWLTEGLGFAFAEAAWDRGEPRHLLRRPALLDLPACSLIPLHTGIGLSLARRLLPDLESSDPAIVAAGLERFARLCRDNSRDGYALAAYEALGLVVRQLAPQAAGEIDRALARGDGDRRGAFWHGLGRGLYVAATQVLPGSLGRAVDRLRRETPAGLGRLNALSGLAWAVTLINFRQPAVLEAMLKDQPFDDDEADAVGRGIAAALLLWFDAAGEETHFAAFRGHRPEAGVAERWQRMVTEPCAEALAGWHQVKSGPGPGEIFRLTSLPESSPELSPKTDLEREVDGMIGRMVSWLTMAPIGGRREDDAETTAGDASRHSPARGEATVAEPVSEAEVEEVNDASGASDPLEREILDALAASDDGAAIRDLQRRTDGKPTTLRTRLKRLIESGRVERRGAGMRTRYHLVIEGRRDG